MPDHLHALVSVNGETPLGDLVRNFKRITARMAKIQWQRNFFDHRIRASEGVTKKAFYVTNNPVRAGLVSCAEDWPYQLGTLSITNVIDR